MEVGLISRPRAEVGEKIETEHFDYKVFQSVVGGTFEYAFVGKELEEQGIDAIINAKGKGLELDPSAFIVRDGEILDAIAGPILFVSSDDKGNSIGLSENQIEYIKNSLIEFALLQDKRDGSEFGVLILQA